MTRSVELVRKFDASPFRLGALLSLIAAPLFSFHRGRQIPLMPFKQRFKMALKSLPVGICGGCAATIQDGIRI